MHSICGDNFCRNLSQDCGPTLAGVALVTVVVGGLLAMLGCGIAGATGKLPMHYTGVRVLIGMPISVVSAVIVIAIMNCINR